MDAPATSTTAITLPELQDAGFFAATAFHFSSQGPAHARRLVEIAWLLMAEGHPIVEDMDGAIGSPELAQSLKLVLAEFLADLDLRISGIDSVRSSHVLALALEHGTAGLGHLSGADFASLLNLAHDDSPQMERARMTTLWRMLLADFPIVLVDPLRAENQGATLTALRQWTRMCKAFDVPSDFLVDLMKAV